MKQKALRIRSEAREEIEAAFEWYFERSPKVAGAFLAEIDASLAQIAAHPQLYPPYAKSTRRRILEKFPYSVVFQERAEGVVVLALAHSKRRFGYWRKRV